MQARAKYAALIVCVVIAGIGYGGFCWWRMMRELGYESCLSSITNVERQPMVIQLANESGERWRYLTESETRDALQKFQGGDCGGFGDPLYDLQKNRINIAVRKPEGRVEVVVWSNGRDGISGTDDDIVMPYGRSIPKY